MDVHQSTAALVETLSSGGVAEQQEAARQLEDLVRTGNEDRRRSMLEEHGLVAGFIHVLTGRSSTKEAKQSVLSTIEEVARRPGGCAVLLERQVDLLKGLGSLVTITDRGSSSTSTQPDGIQLGAMRALQGVVNYGNVRYVMELPGVVTALLQAMSYEGCACAGTTLEHFINMASRINLYIADVPGLLSGMCEAMYRRDQNSVRCRPRMAKLMADLARIPHNHRILGDDAGWLPCLVSMLASSSGGVAGHAARALSYMAHYPPNAARIATMPGAIASLMACVQGAKEADQKEDQEAAVRALGALISADICMERVPGLHDTLLAVINNSNSTTMAKQAATTAMRQLTLRRSESSMVPVPMLTPWGGLPFVQQHHQHQLQQHPQRMAAAATAAYITVPLSSFTGLHPASARPVIHGTAPVAAAPAPAPRAVATPRPLNARCYTAAQLGAATQVGDACHLDRKQPLRRCRAVCVMCCTVSSADVSRAVNPGVVCQLHLLVALLHISTLFTQPVALLLWMLLPQNFAHRLGAGGLGTVYRGNLQGTPVAVKVLHSPLMGPSGGSREVQASFTREVAALSQLRHPHLVLLLGACPQSYMLVYELMEGGSLEEALFDASRPPLLWQVRCSEGSSAHACNWVQYHPVMPSDCT
jgi:hypothetical protein